jgi:hypothetical protein
MRHLKLLGLAALTFGVIITAPASAEPAGILYLSGETAPVKVEGKVAIKQTLLQLGLKSATSITATELIIAGELGAGIGEATHSTLGPLAFTYAGVKLGKLSCSGENAKGEKDAKEVVLLLASNTDAHTVSLENSAGKLVPGLLVGLLEEAKRDLTVNCGGVKVLILGAIFFEVQGASTIEEVTGLFLLPILGKCAKTDETCMLELGKWGSTATKKIGEKDEKVLCPLAEFIEKEEECTELKSELSILVTLSRMVALDF